MWRGATRPDGYGVYWIYGLSRRAHRIAYELLVGSIPDGLHLDHLCRVRNCVNPAHLEPVTHAVNVARGEAGRHHSSKTHCIHGHEYTPQNTIIRTNGCRDCRTCNSDRNRRYRARLKATKAS